MKKTIYSREHKGLIARLKKAREAAGLQQQDVARLLNIQSYVSKLESGQRRVDVVQLKTLARIYKKPLEHFIG